MLRKRSFEVSEARNEVCSFSLGLLASLQNGAPLSELRDSEQFAGCEREIERAYCTGARENRRAIGFGLEALYDRRAEISYNEAVPASPQAVANWSHRKVAVGAAHKFDQDATGIGGAAQRHDSENETNTIGISMQVA